MLSGLRPAPRLVWLALSGLVPAVGALMSDAFLFALVGYDILLLVGFVVDARFALRTGAVEAERIVSPRLRREAAEEVTIELSSGAAARAIVIDEAPQALLPRSVTSRPRAVRLVEGGRARVSYAVRPRRRGRFSFGQVNVLADGPLRLARRRLVLRPSGVSDVRVYPDVGDVDRGALDPDLMMAELGIKRVRRRSEGTEFESLRDAVLEDELRRIDWRATARRGRLTARNYELERNHEVLICLDTGRLMGALHEGGSEPSTKLDHAIQSALRLAAVALNNGDRVGVMSFDAEPGVFARPDRGRAQIGRIMETLFDLEPSRADASFLSALAEVRQRQKKRALIVFLTDFVDAEASSIMLDALAILARRHAVLFVALRDPHLRRVADAPIDDLAGTYRSLAALGLERSRSEVVETLAARGVRALDLPPDAVTSGAIQAYLALRAAERL